MQATTAVPRPGDRPAAPVYPSGKGIQENQGFAKALAAAEARLQYQPPGWPVKGGTSTNVHVVP